MIDQITRSVYAKWELIWPEKHPPNDLRYVLQSRRRILLFLFDADGQSDQLVGVVKVSRRQSENKILDRSVEIIGRIRTEVSGPVLETIPLTVSLERVGGLSASFEQAMTGVPMGINHYPWLDRRRHAANWDTWRQWLGDFQHQTLETSEKLDLLEIDRLVVAPLQLAYEEGVISYEMQRDFAAVAHDLDGIKLGSVWRYGDTHHSNMLTHKGKISGVVDWEGAQEDQWPTQDWFQFAFQYLVDVQRLKNPSFSRNDLGCAALRMLLRGDSSPMSNLANRQTDLFLSTLALDAETRSAFVVAFLAHLYWPWGKKPLFEEMHKRLLKNLAAF